MRQAFLFFCLRSGTCNSLSPASISLANNNLLLQYSPFFSSWADFFHLFFIHLYYYIAKSVPTKKPPKQGIKTIKTLTRVSSWDTGRFKMEHPDVLFWNTWFIRFVFPPVLSIQKVGTLLASKEKEAEECSKRPEKYYNRNRRKPRTNKQEEQR